VPSPVKLKKIRRRSPLKDLQRFMKLRKQTSVYWRILKGKIRNWRK